MTYNFYFSNVNFNFNFVLCSLRRAGAAAGRGGPSVLDAALTDEEARRRANESVSLDISDIYSTTLGTCRCMKFIYSVA
jgi:hypothetical protein